MVAAEGSIDRALSRGPSIGRRCFFAACRLHRDLLALSGLAKTRAPRVTLFRPPLAGACVVVMPLLARSQRRVSVRAEHPALQC